MVKCMCVYIYMISLQFSCLVKLWWLILKPLLAPTLFVRCLLHLEIDRVSGYFLSLSLPLSLFDYSTVCICHSFLCSMLLSHHYNNVQSRSVLITRTHTHTWTICVEDNFSDNTKTRLKASEKGDRDGTSERVCEANEIWIRFHGLTSYSIDSPM